MEAYIILYSVIILASFESFQVKRTSYLFWLIAIIIICFAAFRGNGYDWESYNDIYNNIKTGGEQSGLTFIEYGYVLLCKISPSYKFLIFLCAIISLSCTFSSVYKFSKSYLPVLGLLIFSSTMLLPTYMGQIRQGLAMGFTCIAVYKNFINEKKKAILWIAIACCFHTSAILASLIFLISAKRYKISYYIIIILGALSLYGVSVAFMTNLMNILQISPIQKLLYYASTEKEELGITSTILIRITTLLIAVILNKNSNKKISYLCNVYFCGILVYLLFGFIPQLAGRGCYYFVIYDMVLVPFIVYHFRNNFLLFLLAYGVVIGLSVFRMVSFFSKDLNIISYIPYMLY